MKKIIYWSIIVILIVALSPFIILFIAGDLVGEGLSMLS